MSLPLFSCFPEKQWHVLMIKTGVMESCHNTRGDGQIKPCNSKQIPLRLKLHPELSLGSDCLYQQTPCSHAKHKAGPDKALNAFSNIDEDISETGHHTHPCPQTTIFKSIIKKYIRLGLWEGTPSNPGFLTTDLQVVH